MDRNEKQKLVPTSDGQCIWVDAGVISYRLCTLKYQCERCSLHQALMDGPELIRPESGPVSEKQIDEARGRFKDLFDSLPASARKCRHMLSGEVSYKLCVNSFNCANCSFAQMIKDCAGVEPDTPENEEFIVSGLRLAGGMHYHRGHVWVHVEREGDIRVGLDDFAQRLLGKIERVRLPSPGDELAGGASACEVYMTPASLPVPTPVSGRVIAVNSRLAGNPGLINEHPYTAGWLYTLKPSDLHFELMNLLYGKEARMWFEQEIIRAMEMVATGDEKKKEPQIAKGSAWHDGRDGQMTVEFLLAKAKKAA